MAGECPPGHVFDPARADSPTGGCYPYYMEGEDSKDRDDAGFAPGGDYGDDWIDPETGLRDIDKVVEAGLVSGEDQAGYNDIRAAELLQEQFQLMRQQYIPVADQLRSWFGEWGDQKFDAGVDRARTAGLGAGTMAAGMANRSLNRYGVDLTPQQRQQLQTGIKMDRIAGGVGAANNARQQLMDTKLSGMQKFIGLGHGIGSQGIGNVVSHAGQMSDMYAQNQMMEDQARQQSTSNLIGLGTSAAMLAFLV